ncbi:DUF2975 domain-containing protein [Microbispora sp. NPDC049125]|uniref:DUF2975 domain-containing protein n=1 Tax=Microbispora sp. NPDC049125 TaxID=3154929 RepID=UPI003465214A
MARTRSYAGPRLIRFLAGLTVWIGVIAAFWGVAYAINGATQAKGRVTVPVTIGKTSEGEPPEIQLPKAHVPDAVRLSAVDDAVALSAPGSTVAEQLLSRGDTAVTGLCLGLAAVLLRRLLLSVLEGTPFRGGNPARIAGLAGLLLFAAIVGEALPDIGAGIVLSRLDLGPMFTAGVSIPMAPILVALLLLVLAEAFRRGGELADDVAATI